MKAIKTDKTARLASIEASKPTQNNKQSEQKISRFNLKLSQYSNKLGLCFVSNYK